MFYITLIAAIVMAWTLLRVLGDERQRRRNALHVLIEAEREEAADSNK